MAGRAGRLVTSTEVGIAKAEKENYAYISDNKVKVGEEGEGRWGCAWLK